MSPLRHRHHHARSSSATVFGRSHGPIRNLEEGGVLGLGTPEEVSVQFLGVPAGTRQPHVDCAELRTAAAPCFLKTIIILLPRNTNAVGGL
ncbi:hypothetical protein RHMOL_Rhmol09G0228500 [Rhododendron molle]|uniref:Uncharacterized protein n=1 Tax=Rhododendron molle TaxID=49168 RepID=A0ACC0MHF1_RHOML|nr:hypothetical protein RHMOL_Rhmol09G0228500 [Rhododendron molle]